jgi:hypothetical protein
MTDPRNIAHDKKVQQEKKHRHEEVSPGAAQTVQPGKKPQMTVRPDAPAADDAVELDDTAGGDGKASSRP